MRLYRWVRRWLPFDCGGKHYGNHEWVIDGPWEWRCEHCPNRLVESPYRWPTR